MSNNASNQDKINTILQKIDDMHDLLQAEAEVSERLRRPTPAVQEVLRDSGIFHVLLRERFGGAQATALDLLKVISRLSYADASIGWLARVLISENAYAAASLPPETAEELFGGESKALIAGLSKMDYSGTATETDGGYIVSGDWQYVPGLSMATHVDLGVVVEGTGKQLICTVPRSSLWINDNWNMLGLQSSGTLDYKAHELFVEKRFTFSPGEGDEAQGNLLNELPALTLSRLNQSAWGQGVGQRILDELKKLTQDNLDHSERDVTSSEFFAEFARHTSHVRSTDAFLREIWGQVDADLRKGVELSLDTQTMLRLGAALSTRTVLEISQLAHRFAGGYVMQNGTLQRFFRDGHAGTQHRGTAHFVTQQAGALLAGTVPEGSTWGERDELVVPSRV